MKIVELCATKPTVLVLKNKIGYDRLRALVVRDEAAGSSSPRYTVYLLPTSPARHIEIIGRELSYRHACRIARQQATDRGQRATQRQADALQRNRRHRQALQQLLLNGPQTTRQLRDGNRLGFDSRDTQMLVRRDWIEPHAWSQIGKSQQYRITDCGREMIDIYQAE